MRKKFGCHFQLCRPIGTLSRKLLGKIKDTFKYTIILSIHAINIQFDNSERINYPICLKLTHGRHNVYTQPMDMIQNYKKPNKYCVFYPDPENIHIEETLYCDENDEFESKKWTLYVTKKYKDPATGIGSLAKCYIDISNFIRDTPCVTQLKANLEPMYSSVIVADIKMSIFTVKIWSKSQGKTIYSTPRNIFHKPDRPIPTISTESLNIAQRNKNLLDTSAIGLKKTTNSSILSNEIIRDEDEENEQREVLLVWLKQLLKPYEGIEFENFTSSFGDGRIFLALLNIIAPNLCDYQSRITKIDDNTNRYTPKENLDYAIELFSTFKINPIFVESDFSRHNIFIKPNDRYMLQFLSGLKIFMQSLDNNNNNNSVNSGLKITPFYTNNTWNDCEIVANQWGKNSDISLFCSKADAAIEYLSKQSLSRNSVQMDDNHIEPSTINCTNIRSPSISFKQSSDPGEKSDFPSSPSHFLFNTTNIMDTLSLDSSTINEYKHKIKHDPLYYLDNDDDDDDDEILDKINVSDKKLVNLLKKNAILHETPKRMNFNNYVQSDIDFDLLPSVYSKKLFEFHNSTPQNHQYLNNNGRLTQTTKLAMTEDNDDNSDHNNMNHLDIIDDNDDISSFLLSPNNDERAMLEDELNDKSDNEKQFSSIKVEHIFNLIPKIESIPTKLIANIIKDSTITTRMIHDEYDRISRLIKEYSGRRILTYDRFMNMRRFFTFLPENQRFTSGQQADDSFVHNFYDKRQQQIANEYLSRTSIQRLYRNLFDKIQILNDLGKKLEIESLENITNKNNNTIMECNIEEMDTCIVTMEEILKQMEYLCYNIPGLKIDYDPNIAIRQIDSELHILLIKDEKTQQDDEREKFLINERQRFVDLKNQQLENSVLSSASNNRNNDQDTIHIRESFSSFFNHAYGEVKKNVSKFI